MGGWVWLDPVPASGQTELTDLHVWRVARDACACALTVVSSNPAFDAAQLRAALSVHEELVHCTIEVHLRER